MRSFAVLAAVAGLASANYGTGVPSKPSYTTTVVTAYTTYCPSATKITHGGVTYTVTEATTLTISNCPCTITKPVESAKPTGPAPVPSVSKSVPAVAPSASATTTAPAATYTGAASKAQVAGGLLAALGLVAAAL